MIAHKLCLLLTFEAVFKNLVKFLDRTIWISYFALAALTPLIFSTQNSELFEVPKMHFVYFWAVIIFFATVAKFAVYGQIRLPKNWPLFALLIFLTIQILSSFMSIDKFTSFFGYPSRLNGGLASQIAYLIIFAGILINLSANYAKTLLLTVVIAALAVSLWGIPAHFGKDPSCLLLTGRLTSTCWQKDFDPTLRIFSTLGQPNWLASYLALTLPIAIVLFFIERKFKLKFFFLFVILVLLIALLLTTSRAGFVGFAIALVILSPFLIQQLQKVKQGQPFLILLIVGFIIVTLFFGGFLFSRIGEIISKKPVTNLLKLEETNQPRSFQGGTESGEIRLIVWQGAIEVFKARPIIGFGPETFAYSYYLFRPQAHNQTTEWNFFYNKAHNEFLNYLANTGSIGFLAYLLTIATFLWALVKVAKNSIDEKTAFATFGAIAGFIGYLVTVFFGFSTVTSQVTVFIIVASVLTLSRNRSFFEIKIAGSKLSKVSLLLMAIGFLYVIVLPIRSYFADLLITRAKNSNTNSERAIASYQTAIATFPTKNPFYLADFSVALAASSTRAQDDKTSFDLATKAADFATEAQKLASNNLVVLRRVANAYLLISDFDEQYKILARETGLKLTKLAPTDPQSYLTLAKVQAATDQKEKAKGTLEFALKLKPDYQEAEELLEQLSGKAIQ